MTIVFLIISCSILIISALTTPLCNVFFRKVSNTKSSDEETTLPKVSVLLTAFGHSEIALFDISVTEDGIVMLMSCRNRFGPSTRAAS